MNILILLEKLIREAYISVVKINSKANIGHFRLIPLVILLDLELNRFHSERRIFILYPYPLNKIWSKFNVFNLSNMNVHSTVSKAFFLNPEIEELHFNSDLRNNQIYYELI